MSDSGLIFICTFLLIGSPVQNARAKLRVRFRNDSPGYLRIWSYALWEKRERERCWGSLGLSDCGPFEGWNDRWRRICLFLYKVIHSGGFLLATNAAAPSLFCSAGIAWWRRSSEASTPLPLTLSSSAWRKRRNPIPNYCTHSAFSTWARRCLRWSKVPACAQYGCASQRRHSSHRPRHQFSADGHYFCWRRSWYYLFSTHNTQKTQRER